MYADPTLSVIRSRVLGQGDGEDLHETLTVTNCARSVVVVELAVAFDADFADLFEVKDRQLRKKARVLRRVDGSRVAMTYRRQDYLRRTVIEAPGATLSQGTATFLLTLAAGESWSSTVTVVFESTAPRQEQPGQSKWRHRPESGPRAEQHVLDLQGWIDAAPTLQASWDSLTHTYGQSLRDLAALRLHPQALVDGAALPAAGLPWFMAVFGRDSLITSYQALPFAPRAERSGAARAPGQPCLHIRRRC